LYSAARPPSEDEVSAAFLLNFLRYTDWPPRSFATADAPFVIAVVGNEAVATHVRAVSPPPPHQRPAVEVRWIASARGTRAAPFESAQDRENQLLLLPQPPGVLPSSAGSIPRRRFRDLWGKPVLTVSDVPDFTGPAACSAGALRRAHRVRGQSVAIRNARLLREREGAQARRADRGPRP
jgi:hypothetical protein